MKRNTETQRKRCRKHEWSYAGGAAHSKGSRYGHVEKFKCRVCGHHKQVTVKTHGMK